MNARRRGALILVFGYPPAHLGGGPIRTIEAMVEARLTDEPVWIITSAYDLDETMPMKVPIGAWTEVGRAHVYYADTKSWRGLRDMLRAIRRVNANAIYLNSLFSPLFAVLPLLLVKVRFVNIRDVWIAPRGELDPGAMSLKRQKKLVVLRVLRTLGLLRRAKWHGSTEVEASNIRDYVPRASVRVKTNETLIPATDPMRGDNSRVDEPSSESFTAVYLGRVSPKKQTHVLLQAVLELAPSSKIKLKVLGPLEGEYGELCRTIASDAPDAIELRGGVNRDQVFAELRGADLACFPTMGENFGHVIPEALSQGCPVAVGDVTPWTNAVRRSGIVLQDPSSVEEWVQVLSEYAALNQVERSKRRRRAWTTFVEWRDNSPKNTFLDLILAENF